MTTRKLGPAVLLLSAGLLAAPSTARAGDEVIDSVMYADPDVPAAKVVKVFPPRLLSLWLRALERPENDLKCQAAAAVALAQRRDMPGLKAAAAPLARALDQPEQHPTVRLAVAQALIALDAKEAAPSLFHRAQADGVEMRNLVEPALARWGHGPARAVWLERLSKPGLPRREALLAIQGLGTVREAKAAPRLRELALSPNTDPILRLEAARALGAVQTTGLEKDADRLAREKSPPGSVAHLAAASLLRKHRGDEAVKVLQRLAVGDDPAAAAVALEALLSADPGTVTPLMQRVLASPDAAVRGLGVEAHRLSPLAEHILLVAGTLDDAHPRVRTGARKALLEVSRRAEHREAVLREVTRALATDRWRALEQAAILLALLDHKPAAARLVELLRFERPEVFVAAAWGLRRLAVPETLPAQLAEIDRRWQGSRKPDPTRPREMIDTQVAQLAQSLGQARYAAASPVLARFIPKAGTFGPESRAAAIWALGLLHEKAPPDQLVEALIGRVTDESTALAEDPIVKAMSAVALGRMKAEAAVEPLRKYYPRKLTSGLFPNACGWALQRITGEALPTSGTVEVVQRGWFLEPND